MVLQIVTFFLVFIIFMCCMLFFQVLEMFSSEGDLHLELPTGEKEAPRSLWVSEPCIKLWT